MRVSHVGACRQAEWSSRMDNGHMQRIVSGALLGIFSLVGRPTLHAQEHTVIPDRVSCESCTIRVSRVVTLGDTIGPGLVGEFGYVWRSPEEEYFVSSNARPGTVLVFNENGLFLRSFGRKGEGPGEFVFPVPFSSFGDSLWVFDVGRPRLTLVLPDAIETYRIPFLPTEAISIESGFHVLTAFARSPEFIGIPIHTFDRAGGRLVHSFGNDRGLLVPANPLGHMRHVAASGRDRIWASAYNHYRVEEWTASGELLRSFDREAPWFQPWQQHEGPARVAEPHPVLMGTRPGDGGLLWTFHRVADAEWAPQEPGEVGWEGHVRTTALQKESLYDTAIEVIDTARGMVVSRIRVSENILGLAGPDSFFTYEETGPGYPRYVVWRVTLDGYDSASR